MANSGDLTIHAQDCCWDHVPPTVDWEDGSDIRDPGGTVIVTTGARLASWPAIPFPKSVVLRQGIDRPGTRHSLR